jgi:hypothetical protein
MCGVDVPESGRDRVLHERDVLARVRESIRPKADPKHLGVAQPQFRRVHPEQDYAACFDLAPCSVSSRSESR